jgi:hypothetical protein
MQFNFTEEQVRQVRGAIAVAIYTLRKFTHKDYEKQNHDLYTVYVNMGGTRTLESLQNNRK